MRRLITMLTGAIVLLVTGLFSTDAQANFYLAGSFNGESWNNEWKDITNAEVVIELTTNGNEFQIKDSGQNKWYGPEGNSGTKYTFNLNVNQTVTLEKTVTWDNIQNNFILNKGKYRIGVSWHDGNNCPKIVVTKLADTPDTPKFWMYGQVNQNSWSADKQKEITNLTAVTVTDHEYRFRITAEGISNTNWGPSESRCDASNGGTFTCSNNPGDNYFALTQGSYSVQAEYKDGAVVLNVTKSSGPIFDKDLYLFTEEGRNNDANKFTKQEDGTYTLTYNSNKDDKWFRLYDGDIFSPQSNSADETVTGNGTYIHKVWNKGTDDKVKAFKLPKAGEYEFVATYIPNSNNRWEFTVKYNKKIEDMDLYLILWKDNTGTNLGKFSDADEDGIKTLVPEENGSAKQWETGTYDLFVASQIPLNTSGWTNWTAYMYNNGSDLNVTSNKWENMQKSNTGTYKVTVGSKGTVEFYINLSDRNGDTGMKFKAVPPVSPDFNGYFLSGDLNGWMKLKSYSADASGANTVEEMAPYKFQQCTESGMEGWFKLPITVTPENKSGRMHGQFQIIQNGDFHAHHWGHVNDRNSTEYWNNPVSDDANNPTVMKHVNGETDIPNHHIAHNYYKNATIYFNPTSDKCYISGEPQDIYVYYYNQDEKNTDNITINMKSNGYVGKNYTVNPSLENAAFQKGTVGEDGFMNGETHKQLKALVGVEGAEVLYAPVAPGLEESFWADRKEHFYNFGIKNADAVKEGETFVFNGDNIYFINYHLGSITLNLRDYNDDEMYLGQMYDAQGNDENGKPYEDAPIIEYIKARLIALDGGQARYVAKEEVSEGVNGRTNDPSEALTLTFYMHLKNGQNEFSHEIGEYPNLVNWNGMHKDQQATVVKELYLENTNWVDEVATVPLQHSNRYVELEVKLTDLENHYHGTAPKVKPVYLSNFERTENEDGTVTLTMKQADPNANVQAYSDVAPNSTKFKLDGSHKYFTYKFDDPDVVTGVKDIEVEGNVEGNAEAVYYTLQGVKTDKPVKGRIYIVVRGNKSSKVVY